MLVQSLSPYANMVIAYVTLAGGTGLIVCGIHRSNAGQKVAWVGMLLLTIMMGWINSGYGIRSTAGESIAFFNGLYDPFYNIGNPSGDINDHPGLIPCLDTANGSHNNCAMNTGLGYKLHASWAANFHHRFTEKTGWAFNVARLYAHIWMNTAAFIIALVQFDKNTRSTMIWLHRKLGWVVTILTTSGTLTACWLGSEHHSEELYGGSYGMWGWFSMGSCVLGTLWAGIAAVKRKDIAAHKKWMVRWYGSMWGAFLVFRVLFLLGGLLRFHKTAMSLIAVWTSAPLGIVIAEWHRLRSMAPESAKLE
jgi:hypothetical protein